MAEGFDPDTASAPAAAFPAGKSAGYALATALGECGARVTIHETTRLPGGSESDRLTATLADGTQVGIDVRFEEDK